MRGGKFSCCRTTFPVILFPTHSQTSVLKISSQISLHTYNRMTRVLSSVSKPTTVQDFSTAQLTCTMQVLLPPRSTPSISSRQWSWPSRPGMRWTPRPFATVGTSLGSCQTLTWTRGQTCCCHQSRFRSHPFYIQVIFLFKPVNPHLQLSPWMAFVLLQMLK